MAAIATVQMQIPDPPSLRKGPENSDNIARRARELARSGLLKYWNPALHPRTGMPPNPGWFAPVDEDSEAATLVPAAMRLKPWEKPFILEGGEGGGVPRGTLELPFSGGLRRLPWSSEAPVRPPTPDAAPKSWTPPDPSSNLPFMSESEPQLAPYVEGGKTSGIFRAGDLTVELQSGYDGPTLNVPDESSDFDIITMTHVEGHAAALMQQMGISEAWLRINNPKICGSCLKDLETKMLPPGATLHVIFPDGTEVAFTGRSR
jgi:hypothetical protein